MDINGELALWCKYRTCELEIELDIITGWHETPFETDTKEVKSEEFKPIIDCLKNICLEDIVEQKTEIFNGDMAKYYDDAIINWYQIREGIAGLLPADRVDSYRQMTRQIYARLYDEFAILSNASY